MLQSMGLPRVRHYLATEQQKALSPNIVTLGVRVPTYEFWGTQVSLTALLVGVR